MLYSDRKRFRLKKDIRLYDDDAKSTELLRISTQSVFDFSGAYDVHDSATGARVGTLKREGLSSTFLRDQWQVFDADGGEIGRIIEDSTLKALARCFGDRRRIRMARPSRSMSPGELKQAIGVPEHQQHDADRRRDAVEPYAQGAPYLARGAKHGGLTGGE